MFFKKRNSTFSNLWDNIFQFLFSAVFQFYFRIEMKKCFLHFGWGKISKNKIMFLGTHNKSINYEQFTILPIVFLYIITGQKPKLRHLLYWGAQKKLASLWYKIKMTIFIETEKNEYRNYQMWNWISLQHLWQDCQL